MAELLDRLLSRQRRRNPLADVMGPDPLDSAAIMDAAQGADVSMPAPVSGRARMADPGDGILTSGGGSPFRTASMGGGGTPVQAAIQSGGGQTQATQTQCPGGRCPTPRRTVISSGPQYFDDGGLPVTSTVVGSPTVSSGAPVMTGGTVVSSPSVPYGNTQALADMAWQQQQMGQPAGRALAERLGNYSRTDEVIRQSEINDAHTRKTTDEAAKQSRERLQQEIATARANDDMTRAMKRDLDERLATSYIDMREEIEADFDRTGDVNGYAVALARLMMKSQPIVGKDGQTLPQEEGPIPEQILKRATQEAYSTAAVNALLGNAIIQRDAANLGESFNSRLVPRGADESDEAYAARANAILSTMETDGLHRAATSIISGLKETEVWQKRDWNGIQKFLDGNVRYSTVSKMKRLYATMQPVDESLPPRERKAMELARDAEATRRALTIADFIRDEAKFALTEAGEPQGRSWSEWAYGEDPPGKTPAVDSNDTLPDAPVRGANPRFR